MKIRELVSSERPRERLLRYGADALATSELLAILLGSGTARSSVLELAAQLLSHFGSLEALAYASLQELKQVPGIGQAKATLLQAVFTLARRLEAESEESPLLDTPDKLYRYTKGLLHGKEVEHLVVILRDVRRRCLHAEVLSKGTLTDLLAHPREIFHTAIKHRAHSLVLAHNHPSGDPTPSKQDLWMTERLVQASQLIGIEFSDHLILGRGCYVSLAERGSLRSSH